MLRIKVCEGVECSKAPKLNTVFLVFKGAKCSEKQTVLGTKLLQEQSVPRSKVFQKAKCAEK